MNTPDTIITEQQMLAALRQRQSFALRGLQNLENLRRALHAFVRTTGIHFTFDPDTNPRLRDYLAAGGLGAIEGAALGGALGLAVGALFDEPELAGVGAVFGALIGGFAGINRVSAGWRVRATWAPDQTPELFVEPI